MGTERARVPFWSPGGKSIGFFAGGKLTTIAAAAGPPWTLADAPWGHGGNWSPEGVIVFAPEGGPLPRVLASGGTAYPCNDAPFGTARLASRSLVSGGWPPLLIHHAGRGSGENADLGDRIDAQPGSHNRREVAVADSNAVYVPPGYLLSVRERTWMAQPFDACKAPTTGPAIASRTGPRRAKTFQGKVVCVPVARPGTELAPRFEWSARRDPRLFPRNLYIANSGPARYGLVPRSTGKGHHR